MPNTKLVYSAPLANVPCPYCTQPVGYGDHEKYCPENPVNLARRCSRADAHCNGPGRYVTDHGYGWVCDYHNRLEILQAQAGGADGKVRFTEFRIAELEKALAELYATLPDLKAEQVVSRQALLDFTKGA